MLTMIDKAGDFATRDVWFSVVQLVTNHPELHEYAARKVCLWVWVFGWVQVFFQVGVGVWVGVYFV